MPLGPLVSAAELARHREWRVFDCRHDLARPDLGEREYAEAHIPGARFAHLDRDLSGERTGANGRHPLPLPERFAAWLGAHGVRPSDPVVAYDAGNGAMAARLWWMLRWLGHRDAAVLDGGLAKWRAEGRPLTAEVPEFEATRYPLTKLDASMSVDVGTLEQRRDSLLLVDARAPARFRGEQEPIDPVAGHIPGALNRFNSENLTPKGVFKAPGELKQELLALLGGRRPVEAVHYCGSGVAACHNLLAMEIAGLGGGRLYAGSWSEWIADPRRPVAR